MLKNLGKAIEKVGKDAVYTFKIAEGLTVGDKNTEKSGAYWHALDLRDKICPDRILKNVPFTKKEVLNAFKDEANCIQFPHLYQQQKSLFTDEYRNLEEKKELHKRREKEARLKEEAEKQEAIQAVEDKKKKEAEENLETQEESGDFKLTMESALQALEYLKKQNPDGGAQYDLPYEKSGTQHFVMTVSEFNDLQREMAGDNQLLNQQADHQDI